MGNFHPVTVDPRTAGRVSRYHTWPHVREQSVGEHTWQVMRILLAIWPEAPRELLVETIFHDAGERVSGDAPYPIKAQNPTLKSEMDRIERAGRLEMTAWGAVAPLPISEQERAVLKLAEFIEMMEWGLDELALGNQSARLVVLRCQDAAKEILNGDLLGQKIKERAVAYINRRIKHERKYHGYGAGE